MLARNMYIKIGRSTYKQQPPISRELVGGSGKWSVCYNTAERETSAHDSSASGEGNRRNEW